MGRAIVREPKVFLMDEPLSNLDAKLRVQTAHPDRRAAAAPRCHHRVRHPRPGRGDDDGRPGRGDRTRARCSSAPRRRSCSRPGNLFVAGFIGSPAMNIVTGSVDEAGAHVRLAHDPADAGRARPDRRERHDRCAPERLRRRPTGGLDATVDVVEELGSEAFLYCTVSGPTPTAGRPRRRPERPRHR